MPGNRRRACIRSFSGYTGAKRLVTIACAFWVSNPSCPAKFSRRSKFTRWKGGRHVLAKIDRTGGPLSRRGPRCRRPQVKPVLLRGTVAQEGVAEGHVWLHETRVVVSKLVADDPVIETSGPERSRRTILRVSVDQMMAMRGAKQNPAGKVLEPTAVRHSKGLVCVRMEERTSGPVCHARRAVEKEQSLGTGALMGKAKPTAYLRKRLWSESGWTMSNRLAAY